jgi:uncharacterized protein (DUF305 family)
MTRTRRALTLTLVLLTTAAGVSACSEAETPVAPQATPQFTGAAAEGEHNQADVDFATKIFPYHIQANVLAGIGQARGKTQQVKDYATALGQAQPEPIARLGGWLTGWDQKVPTDGKGAPLNAGDVSKLTTVDPAAFDVAWLAMVIKHQQAEIKALNAYEKVGQNPEVEQWVQTLETKQKADLKTAKALLADAKG